MKLKITALRCVLLVVTVLSQDALAQTAQKAAPVFVPMPKDIQCSARHLKVSIKLTVDGKSGSMVEVNTPTSAEGITCAISGSSPGHKKEVPLASTKITRGMLPTKDFGDLKITITGNSGTRIAISSDKLQSFRDFLKQ
jgi:hypothetical protein